MPSSETSRSPTFPASSLEFFTTDADELDVLAATAAALAEPPDGDALLEAILDRVQAEVPFYAGLDRDEFRPGIAGDLARGLRALGEQRPPTPAELERSEEVGAACARQGIPVEAMIHSFQVATRETLAAFHAAAAERGAEPLLLLRVTQAGWAWATFVMAAQAREHRRVELDLARRDEQQRADVLHAVLTGAATGWHLLAAAPVLGLAPDAAHVPFRARPAGDDDVQALRRRIERRLAAAHRPFAVAVIDGDVAGVVAGAPPEAEDAVVGAGPAMPLERIAGAFAEASRAVEVAATFGLTGVHGLADLGMLTAVATDVETGDRLHERYLAPLGALGRFGAELQATLRTWLEHRRHVGRAAAALHVHQNTLRHRLERYEATAAVDLDDPRALAELWWALLHAARRDRLP